MARIAYTGLTASSIEALRHGLADTTQEAETGEFIEICENTAREELAQQARAADVYLIGEEVDNPIKLAQMAHAIDSYLSVIIVNDSKSFSKIKQALLFTPFIGNNVQSLASEIGTGLASATQNAILKTQQRRNYVRLKTAPALQQPNAHIYEDIKSEYLDKFLQEAPIGAVLMTEKGLILAVNRYATRVLDNTEKQLIGAPFSSLFGAAQQKQLAKLFGQDQSSTEQLTIERNSHQTQVLEISFAQITIKNRVPYRLGLITDITDKVLAQQKVEHQLVELQKINHQLSRAVNDLDAFVYTASHDLKAPIANIEGLITLIRKKSDTTDPALQHLFAMVDVSIDRFLATIKDLAEVAQIHKKHTDEDIQTNAFEVIGEVQTLIHKMIESAGATIQLDCPPKLSLSFPKSKFRSIIYNLLTNALKYGAPNRKPLIKIKVERSGDYTMLSVEDNGLGIPADKKDNIFSMFKRLHTHVEGSGIGLFIIKRIVESTDSRIEVESEEGFGSTFRVYLKEQR
ncbi:ATP-binding protein [Cesiribacter sp. SM1]|uniref:sensor histidine kinase n=1 Tax=Cesiribacter sp. SM1 TaxID=2861196 RepID=UPI001CD77DA6|nr:PAS domain-containing sensor histidine kinase [Cesiribacter sp. SM1]